MRLFVFAGLTVCGLVVAALAADEKRGNNAGMLVQIDVLVASVSRTVEDKGAAPESQPLDGLNFGVLIPPDNSRDAKVFLLDTFKQLAPAGTAKILSQPRLMTLSGREASLHQGGFQQVPVVRPDGTHYWTREPLGVDLTCLPIVLDDGHIRLDISVGNTESVPLGEKVEGKEVLGRKRASCNGSFEFESRGAEFMKSSTVTTSQECQIPVIGSLPYLNKLFPPKVCTTQEDTIFLITARVCAPADKK